VAVGTALLGLAAFALLLVVLYFFYGLVFRAFRKVGFTQGEATLILLGTLVLGFVNIPLGRFGEWVLAVNLGGAVVPVVVAYLLLRRFTHIGLEATVGITLVALTTYFVATPTPQGIVSPFPLWLAPPLVAALLSILAFWREETYAAPLAYVSGSLGALIGGDFLHLADFLAQPPPQPGAVASLGGAAIFDMVFLTGILAVGLDVLVFRERRRAGVLDEEGEVVFRSTTPPEFIRDYDPASATEAARRRVERVRQRMR
jgi:uncharacterized membrane protein